MTVAVQDRLMTAIRRINHGYGRYSKRLEERAGVTAPHRPCLEVLADHVAVPAGRLSDEISLDPSTVTGILDRLDLRGLIERRHDTEDRRVWLISITPAGRRTVEKAPPTMGRRLAAVMRRRSKSGNDRTIRALERIAGWMEVLNDDL